MYFLLLNATLTVKQTKKKHEFCIAQELPGPSILLRADISHILHFSLSLFLSLFISLACPHITPLLAPNQQWVFKASSCRKSPLLSAPQSFDSLQITIHRFSALQISILYPSPFPTIIYFYASTFPAPYFLSLSILSRLQGVISLVIFSSSLARTLSWLRNGLEKVKGPIATTVVEKA